jgi:hypothetical protein
LEDGTAPIVVNDTPLLDFLERSEAPQTDQVIVEAAISHTWRLRRAVHITV